MRRHEQREPGAEHTLEIPAAFGEPVFKIRRRLELVAVGKILVREAVLHNRDAAGGGVGAQPRHQFGVLFQRKHARGLPVLPGDRLVGEARGMRDHGQGDRQPIPDVVVNGLETIRIREERRVVVSQGDLHRLTPIACGDKPSVLSCTTSA